MMKGELTSEQASKLYDSQWWVGMDDKDVARAQAGQERTCMPMAEFQMATERAFGMHVLQLRAAVLAGESL